MTNVVDEPADTVLVVNTHNAHTLHPHRERGMRIHAASFDGLQGSFDGIQGSFDRMQGSFDRI